MQPCIPYSIHTYKFSKQMKSRIFCILYGDQVGINVTANCTLEWLDFDKPDNNVI